MESEFYKVALDRLRYSLVWEDSRTLYGALSIQPTDHVLVVASAGCNALNALLKNPRVLILDDATSSVDTATEQLIQTALARLMAGRTSFVIAQRMSTVRQAHQIIVLEKGRIAARGTHEELLERSEIYAQIYYQQLQPPSEKIQSEKIQEVIMNK